MRYLFITLLLLSGCVLTEGIRTPEPTVSPTGTPTSTSTALPTLDPTPTQEVLPKGPLNDNFGFDVDEKFGHITKIGTRSVFTPFAWIVGWYPNTQITDPNPHPDVFARDSAVRFEVSNRGGAFGLASHVNALPGRRYIIVTEYEADLEVIQRAFLNSRDLYGFCRFDNLAGDRAVSDSWRVLMQGEQEFICVFEVSEARTVRFDALINNTWQVLKGHVDILEVRAEEVSPDDFEDSVVQLP